MVVYDLLKSISILDVLLRDFRHFESHFVDLILSILGDLLRFDIAKMRTIFRELCPILEALVRRDRWLLAIDPFLHGEIFLLFF